MAEWQTTYYTDTFACNEGKIRTVCRPTHALSSQIILAHLGIFVVIEIRNHMLFLAADVKSHAIKREAGQSRIKLCDASSS